MTELGIVTEVNPLQSLKAELLIEVTELGIVTSVIFEPARKLSGNISTSLPIVTVEMLDFGISTIEEQFFAFQIRLVKPLQPEKAKSPIEVTELPIVTDVRPERPQHKHAGIFSTSLPNVNVLIPVKPLNGAEYSEKSLQVFAFQLTDVKPLQLWKAELPIVVTELGIVTDVKLEHSLNAPLPIAVTGYVMPEYSTDFGIMTEPPFSDPITVTVIPSELIT